MPLSNKPKDYLYSLWKGKEMTVTELIKKLQEIEEDGLGKLIVAYYDEIATKQVTNCDVCLSMDGVGQYVEIR